MKRSILGFSTFAFAVGTAAAFASGCSSSSGGGTRANGGAGGQGASASGSKCVAGPPGANCEDAYLCGQAHCKADWDACTMGSGACVALFECSKACPCDDNFQNCSAQCAQTNRSIDCGMCLSKYSTCLTANCKSEVDACSGSNVNPGAGGNPPVTGGGGAGNVVIGPGGSGPGGISGVFCDTCEFANDGMCDVPDYCAPGTDCTDCGIVGAGGTGAGGTTGGCDSCQFANDGLCDEPDYCTPGTDCTDCAFVGTGGVPGTGGVSGTGGAPPGGVIPDRLIGSWYYNIATALSATWLLSSNGNYTRTNPGDQGTYTVSGAPADCSLGCTGQVTFFPNSGAPYSYTFTLLCDPPPPQVHSDVLDLRDADNIPVRLFRLNGERGFCG